MCCNWCICIHFPLIPRIVANIPEVPVCHILTALERACYNGDDKTYVSDAYLSVEEYVANLSPDVGSKHTADTGPVCPSRIRHLVAITTANIRMAE